LRVLVVGALTVVLSIDSASACRLFRSRCRPRCRVVTWQPCESIVIVESLPRQCCVPADGSAHAVIVETEQAIVSAPSEAPSAPAAEPTAPVAVDEPRPATPTPVKEPLEPLEPIAPASAEKPLSPPPPAAPETQPQFKTAAEILAESAEKERIEKAAAEALKAAAPAAEPPMKEVPIEPANDEPAPAPVPEEPEAPAEPAPKKPAPKPAAENFFDEGGDAAEEAPPRENRAPMKKKEAPKEPVEDLFNEPEADTPPADSETEPTEKPAEEAPSEEPTEKTEDDPFAALEADPEPVRRWIDSTGRHETIGRLVEVHSDRVRILKTNGRYTTVPMQQLSRHDRAYAATVGERLAGRAPARPAATDTAHR
jgi:hypothetical protein